MKTEAKETMNRMNPKVDFSYHKHLRTLFNCLVREEVLSVSPSQGCSQLI